MNDQRDLTKLHPSAISLTNQEVVGILQSKLESLRLTLTEKEYRTLPHVRHMEETLKYALTAHRATSYQSREHIERKRAFLEEFPLRLVERQVDDAGHVHLTQEEVTAMLNLEPKNLAEMNILFSWTSKYEPLDVESLIIGFVASGIAKRV